MSAFLLRFSAVVIRVTGHFYYRSSTAMRNEARRDRLRSLTKEEKPCHTEERTATHRSF